MSRPKSTLNKAAEQFACPSCYQPKNEACVNTEGNTTATHRARQNLVCQETFFGLPATMISAGKSSSMACARRAGHTSQHQTLDKRLTWAQDYGVEERAALDDLMAKTG